MDKKIEFIQKFKQFASKHNIKYNNIDYYYEAFSHPSYANEIQSGKNYERLEFLGDAVLELVVSDYLYKNFEEEEGEMTKWRANFVCENALFEENGSTL